MSILQYASPQYEYDYFDKQVLDNYQKDAAAYNKAVEDYNANPQGEFTAKPPSFDGDIEAFSREAAEKAQAVGASQATAQAVMTDPAQTYRTKAGDVNLGGMAGFAGESGVDLAGLAGFADGGIVQNFAGGGEAMESPYADPMKSNNMLPPTSPIFAPQVAQQQAEMQQFPHSGMGPSGGYPPLSYEQPRISDLPAPDNQQADFNSQNLGGLGGLFGELFSGGGGRGLQQATAAKPQVQGAGLGGQGQMDQFQQMMQMRQGFDQQMGGMRGAPLENYKQYLNQTYTGPEMQEASAALSGALEGRVDEFVGMVDEAERAHFDAEESFGFGGGPMSGGGNPLGGGRDIQRAALMQRGQGQEDQMPMQGLGSAINNFQMFEDGGRVEARPPESGPTPEGVASVFYKEMANGGVPNPEDFKPEVTETNFEYSERPSYPEVRQMYVRILEDLSDKEIQAEYGVSKKDLGETLAMLDVQYTYGSTDGPEGVGERYKQTKPVVPAPEMLTSKRPEIRPPEPLTKYEQITNPYGPRLPPAARQDAIETLDQQQDLEDRMSQMGPGTGVTGMPLESEVFASNQTAN